jgi:hypothetical protein
MTAQILLNILRHSIIKMEAINLLILDECHHAVKKHPYSLVMFEFYYITNAQTKEAICITNNVDHNSGPLDIYCCHELLQLVVIRQRTRTA